MKNALLLLTFLSAAATTLPQAEAQIYRSRTRLNQRVSGAYNGVTNYRSVSRYRGHNSWRTNSTRTSAIYAAPRYSQPAFTPVIVTPTVAVPVYVAPVYGFGGFGGYARPAYGYGYNYGYGPTHFGYGW